MRIEGWKSEARALGQKFGEVLDLEVEAVDPEDPSKGGPTYTGH